MSGPLSLYYQLLKYPDNTHHPQKREWKAHTCEIAWLRQTFQDAVSGPWFVADLPSTLGATQSQVLKSLGSPAARNSERAHLSA